MITVSPEPSMLQQNACMAKELREILISQDMCHCSSTYLCLSLSGYDNTRLGFVNPKRRDFRSVQGFWRGEL